MSTLVVCLPCYKTRLPFYKGPFVSGAASWLPGGGTGRRAVAVAYLGTYCPGVQVVAGGSKVHPTALIWPW